MSAESRLRAKLEREGRTDTVQPATQVPDAAPVRSPLSLPPAAVASPTPPAPTLPKTLRKLKQNSKVVRTAIKIKALQISGLSHAEIGKVLGMSEKTIPHYLYIAGKNGYLDHHDPHEKLTYEIIHKAVRNLDAMLDDPDPSFKQMKAEVTMETLKGTAFKKFGEITGPTQQMNVLSIKVELPAGGNMVIREGTVGGTPAYQTIEGEVLATDAPK